MERACQDFKCKQRRDANIDITLLLRQEHLTKVRVRPTRKAPFHIPIQERSNPHARTTTTTTTWPTAGAQTHHQAAPLRPFLPRRSPQKAPRSHAEPATQAAFARSSFAPALYPQHPALHISNCTPRYRPEAPIPSFRLPAPSSSPVPSTDPVRCRGMLPSVPICC